VAEVVVQLHETGAEADQIQALTELLRHELLDLDVADVRLLATEEAPRDSRGVALPAVGDLLVIIKGSLEVLDQVLSSLRSWVQRQPGSRAVEIRVGEASLRLEAPTAEEQSRLVEEFVRLIGEAGEVRR
jgi:hypothetical protein